MSNKENCKHLNVQASMFNTFNNSYIAVCIECKEEIILGPIDISEAPEPVKKKVSHQNWGWNWDGN